MNTDYLYIGPTPVNENCAQVGDPDFNMKASKEMKAFINQLYRTFPDATENSVKFRIKWELHDFGKYGEVVVDYNCEDEMSYSYALNIDSNIPENWDEEALKELNGDNESI